MGEHKHSKGSTHRVSSHPKTPKPISPRPVSPAAAQVDQPVNAHHHEPPPPPPQQVVYAPQPQQVMYAPPQQVIYTNAPQQMVYAGPGMMYPPTIPFTEFPQRLVCPQCSATVITNAYFVAGVATWLWCLGLSLFM
jgi:hypothetical protein